jgi:hypothetical protein
MAVYYPTNNVLASTVNSNVTIGGTAGVGSITVTGMGGGGTGSVLMSNGTGTTWANNTNAKMTTKGQLHLEGEDADLVINGISLKEILNGITDRLSILQPKPELLAKYENLRQAYEHYRTLETLLHQEDDDAK